jgi:hypothetical protein
MAIQMLHAWDLAPDAAARVQTKLRARLVLAFREGPAVLAAREKLKAKPDLLMLDGQGIAHPRGVGIASHLGLWLERATACPNPPAGRIAWLAGKIYHQNLLTKNVCFKSTPLVG